MIIFRLLSATIAICAILCAICVGLDLKKNKKDNMIMDYSSIALILVLLVLAIVFFYWAIC